MEPGKIGIVGCGNISGIYFQAGHRFAEIMEIAACADLVPERAQAAAAANGVPKACTVAELLADPEIRVVLNLTIPKAHGEVALKALRAGKSVYNEKPLAVTREDGREMLGIAAEKGLLVGCAPDTFMGGGHQTCRKLIDDGAIGVPVAATAFMMCHGHETWHPDPDFYYQPGGGPMFDMGPYYLTALVNMLGPIRRVTGSARITFPERLITSEPKNGAIIKVNTPTHIAGVMDFASGAVGTIITSFDVYAAEVPAIQVFGTEGTLTVPDPNGFGGTPRLWRDGEWREVPLTHIYADNARGMGLADMVCALRSGRPYRADGKVAYHVLDVMHAFGDASKADKHILVESTCERPQALPVGLEDGRLDL